MQKIDIGPSTIGEEILLKWGGLKKLIIPDYQRNYVWDDERIEEFRFDLTEERQSIPFLGSIIFKEEPGNDKLGYPLIDIVDGQQRTITISLFLSALRNVAKIYNLEHFAKTVQGYLEEPDGAGGFTGHYFLECWKDVQPTYKEYILKYDGDIGKCKSIKNKKKQESLRNMQKNYNYIVKLLNEHLQGKDDVLGILKDILTKILEYQIVVIKVKSDQEAYVAFEIVNASGVKLENIDLLKNLFIKESYQSDIQDEVKARWEEMSKYINDAETKGNIESFLKHFWSSRRGYITGKDLYVSFKKLINDEGAGKISKEMNEDAKMYYNFGLPEGVNFLDDYAYNSSVVRGLTHIKSFGLTQPYIILLCAFRFKNELGEKRVRNIVKLIEYFHFIYSVIGKGQANKVEKIYCKYSESFRKLILNPSEVKDPKHDDFIQQEFDKFKSDMLGLLKDFVPKEDFMIGFTNLELKSTNKDIIRYVLSLYELSITSGGTKPNFEITNIEHIYPQNDSKQAENNLLINNIGNLMLLEKNLNSKGGNLPLDEKIPIYEECNVFQQVKEIVVEYYQDKEKNIVWSESKIRDRAKRMGESIYNYIYEKGFGKM